jgi:hypothetical protein
MTESLPSPKEKFGIVEGDENRAYRYPSCYYRESVAGSGERLVLGEPAASYSKLLMALAGTMPEPFLVLYVLVVRRGTANAGRYQSPEGLTFEALRQFLTDFGEFFERDGRHHLWIANPGYGKIVFDRHNLVYAYGDLDAFEEVARDYGMVERHFEVPTPHWHSYHPEYDQTERQLFRRWQWIQSSLRPQDEI